MSAKIKEKIDASVEGKIRNLYELQLIDSKIDRLRTILAVFFRWRIFSQMIFFLFQQGMT